MSDPKWQDHHLTEIIEAQLVLFFHLSAALDEAGILPRDISAQVLRRSIEQGAFRPGVKSCVRAIAELLEAPDRKAARPGWEPRVVTGDAGPDGPEEGAGQAGNGQAGNGQAGNGQAGNGKHPAAWQPYFVGDDDPDCA
jgi:hypothetical protein